MDSTSTSYSGGIGFTGLLTVVFIVLKLIGKIDWSWWWVWSPLWIPWVAILGSLVMLGAIHIARLKWETRH